LRLLDELKKEPAFDGHISYHYRSGFYRYFMGSYKGPVEFVSDRNQDQWSDDEVEAALIVYRAEVG